MIKDQADSQVFDESVDEYDSIEVRDNSRANLSALIYYKPKNF